MSFGKFVARWGGLAVGGAVTAEVADLAVPLFNANWEAGSMSFLAAGMVVTAWYKITNRGGRNAAPAALPAPSGSQSIWNSDAARAAQKVTKRWR